MKPETRIRSTVMRILASDARRNASRLKARVQRLIFGKPPVVHYFHQADDPYSHLAVQRFTALRARYGLEWVPHLVSAPPEEYQGDVERFRQWALGDARSVASYFKVDFSANPVLPSSEMVRVANQKLLDCLASADFGEKAAEIGEKMWSGNLEGSFNENEIAAALEEGNQLRRRKRHYLGAMFYFDGEWYWGLDRLHLLEERLCSLGFGQGVDTDLCVPQPEVDSVSGLNANSVTLEYFPSLRSPYTAVGHGRVMDLVDRSGVQLRIRPVMPMMMRGVSAPIDKQLYIISDSKREAAANNVRFGNFVDPFGEPVKRAFSLYPWVESQGRGAAFITAYLEAAWADGLDIGSDAGLRQIIESIELDWKEALSQFDNDQWERLLDDNVQEMLAEGLWGVPSFRITGGNRDDGFSCWGQDRIWRVEAEISRRVN